MSVKLADLKQEFSKYFFFKDPWALEIILASFIGNMVVERDPLWILIVGASSGGKTTLLAPAVGIPNVHFIDDMTEKTLLSGFKQAGKEMSLLKQIGSGTMVFSDFTSILAKNKVSRGEILTQLKLVYDGKVTKHTGTGVLPWQGKVGFIAASTPDVYSTLEESRSLGERFLYYWLEQPSNQEVMEKQAEHDLSAKAVTDIMSDYYREYYLGVQNFYDKHQPPFLITPAQRKQVNDAARFCVYGKATVRMDFKTSRPDAIPTIAGVGRDAKMFETLLYTLQLMAAYEKDDPRIGVTDEMLHIVEKCAYSSINRERRKILEVLVEHRGPRTTTQIGAAEGIGLEKESIMKYLAPLHAVGLIKKKAGSGGAHQWYIGDDEVFAFVERVSKSVVDYSPVAALEEVGEGALLEEYQEEQRRYTAGEEEMWAGVPTSN